jgi:hypothetical protein
VNEIIRELILEAGFPTFGKMYVVSDGEELERFAELVVRKCAELVDDHDDSYPYVSFGDMIKRHFGVGE